MEYGGGQTQDTMAQRSGKHLYLVALALFLAGVGYLTYTGLTENSVYFLNVSEALAAPADRLKSARLFGTVAEEGLTRADDGLSLRFRLEDKDNPARTIDVAYKGAVPDTFKPGAEVIVEGGVGPGPVFSATSLMTKCPSKYQKENRT